MRGGKTIGRRLATLLAIAMVTFGTTVPGVQAAPKRPSLDFVQVPGTASAFDGAELSDVAGNDKAIVAVGLTFAPGENHGHPVVFTSKTGGQWKQISDTTLGIPATLRADSVRVTVGSKGFLILTNGGDVLLSSDARTWTFVPDSATKLAYGGEPLVGTHLIVYDILDVVETAAGYVASGQGCVCAAFRTGDHTPAVVTSADGRTWSAPIPVDPGFHNDPSSIAAGPNGLVLGVGGDPGAVFTSSDGNAWTRVDASVFASLGPKANFPAVAAGRAGAVIVGYALDADAVPSGPPFVWHSDDGASWKPVGASTFGKPGVQVAQVLATDDGFVAFGTDGTDAASWTSRDGTSWHAGPPPGGAFTRVVEVPRGLVAIVSSPAAVWVAGDFKLPTATSAATLPVADFQLVGLDYTTPPTEGAVTVKVLEAQFVSSISDPSGEAKAAKPKGRYLAVRYRISNDSNESVYTFLVVSAAQVVDGTALIAITHEKHPVSDWQYFATKRPGDKPMNSLHIGKGKSATTWAVYDIPEDLQPTTLTVRGDNGPITQLAIPKPKKLTRRLNLSATPATIRWSTRARSHR